MIEKCFRLKIFYSVYNKVQLAYMNLKIGIIWYYLALERCGIESCKTYFSALEIIEWDTKDF